MKALLLDGTRANDSNGERIRNILVEELKSSEWVTEHIILEQSTIGNRAGDFYCWILVLININYNLYTSDYIQDTR